MKKKLITTLLLLVILKAGFSQGFVPQGINFQAVASDSTGKFVKNQWISVMFQVYSDTVQTPNLQWEEIHNVTTNQFGLFNLQIGKGIGTANSQLAAFSNMDWGSGKHILVTQLDVYGGTNYKSVDTSTFLSVPYALYSANAAEVNDSVALAELYDVDTSGAVSGNYLKWNGNSWIPSALTFPDTVNYSYNSDSSLYADTAQYAYNCLNIPPAWGLGGNSGTSAGINFLGTKDSSDLVIKTNNIERMRITASGQLGMGTSSPLASLHLVGNDGFVASGTFGSGSSLPVSGSGTRMFWYPKKAAIRAGYVSNNFWNDANIGDYSAGFGYGSLAAGAYSFAAGENGRAYGNNATSIGYANRANGDASVAMGSVNYATGYASIAMGRGNNANDSASVALGYWNTASGKFSSSFGYFTTASANYSTSMGYYANANQDGCFVFADASSTSATTPTAANQFVVRASGGVFLYSNSGASAGVSLASGAGSWSSVSDKNKKENFEEVNGEEILNGLEELQVSTWNYKSQSEDIRHIGPMAQDFHRIFGFGGSDTTITTIDMDGVNMAAIQALNEQAKTLREKSQRIEELDAEVNLLQQQRKELLERIIKLENIASSGKAQETELSQGTGINETR